MLLIMAVDNVDAVSFFFRLQNDTDFANKIDARFEQKKLGEEEHRYDEYIFSEGLLLDNFQSSRLLIRVDKRRISYPMT